MWSLILKLWGIVFSQGTQIEILFYFVQDAKHKLWGRKNLEGKKRRATKIQLDPRGERQIKNTRQWPIQGLSALQSILYNFVCSAVIGCLL